MMLNANFNNILVISWQSVLLVEETGVPGGKPANLNHIMLYRVHLAWVGFELTRLLAIGTDCIGSNNSDYHAITTVSE